jgi:hypothetical protein
MSHTIDQSQSYVTTWCQAPIWGPKPDFYYCQRVSDLLMWGALSDERTGLSFTIAVGPRQRSHWRVRVPRDSWPYFTVSDSRLPLPGGPGPRIYMPQEKGDPVIPPGTGFHFRPSYDSQGYGGGIRTRLYAGYWPTFHIGPRYVASAWTTKKTPLLKFLCCCVLIRCCLTMTASARSTVPASSRHVTILRSAGSWRR